MYTKDSRMTPLSSSNIKSPIDSGRNRERCTTSERWDGGTQQAVYGASGVLGIEMLRSPRRKIATRCAVMVMAMMMMLLCPTASLAEATPGTEAARDTDGLGVGMILSERAISIHGDTSSPIVDLAAITTGGRSRQQEVHINADIKKRRDFNKSYFRGKASREKIDGLDMDRSLTGGCVDDPSYTFNSWNKMPRLCSWIVENSKRSADRRDKHCSKIANGRKIGDACPQSCGYCSSTTASLPQYKKPNLLMVITDEHNLRTISSYRNYLLTKHNKTQVDVWGEDVHLETPMIDSLADEGALFTNFKSVLPYCTPSRSSLLTGQYPAFTNTMGNHNKLSNNTKTWADILRDERGYATSYMGKFHLDGKEKPGWGASTGRDFGFDDNKYRYNRGHWKYFNETNGIVQEHNSSLNEKEFLQDHKEEESYATDFLVNRAMEYIENVIQGDKPFALVLSLADPHSPNFVRPHYRDMYKNLDFNYPESGRKKLKFDPAPPSFNGIFKNVPIDDVDAYIANYEDRTFLKRMQQYFGMCKCLDDNIVSSLNCFNSYFFCHPPPSYEYIFNSIQQGRLLDQMKDLGIDQDTVVVFTSDHGDMLGEHAKLDKGTPYETSAGVPFIVKYPRKVLKGKIIETAYSTVDFAPTILSLMGVPELPFDVNFQGIDGSLELMSNQTISANSDQIVFLRHYRWAAAIKGAYKLIVSKNEEAFLFDLSIDPEELINFVDSSEHQAVKAELQAVLGEDLVRYPSDFARDNVLFFDKPACYDNRNVLRLESGEAFFCKTVTTGIAADVCGNASIKKHCSKTCNACSCIDSSGLIFVQGKVQTCVNLSSACSANQKVQEFCPRTCGECSITAAAPSIPIDGTSVTKQPPSFAPSNVPSAAASSPTDEPSADNSLPTNASSDVPSSTILSTSVTINGPSSTSSPTDGPSVDSQHPSSFPSNVLSATSVLPTFIPSDRKSTDSHHPSSIPSDVPSITSILPSSIPSDVPSSTNSSTKVPSADSHHPSSVSSSTGSPSDVP